MFVISDHLAEIEWLMSNDFSPAQMARYFGVSRNLMHKFMQRYRIDYLYSQRTVYRRRGTKKKASNE